jgi:hypothetical protein
MSLFAMGVPEVVWSKVGAHGQQKVLTEWCLEDQVLEHTLCWTLEARLTGQVGSFEEG